MIVIILKRLAISILIVLVVSFLVFFLDWITPGDQADYILGAGGTPAQYEALREQLGLNQPMWAQYLSYLGHLVTGDLGIDYATKVPVTKILADRLPVTLSLIAVAMIGATVVGIALGILSAVRRGVLGWFINVLAVAGFALPSFWVGLVLVQFFAVDLKWFPAIGFVPLAVDPAGWARSIALPVIALALPGIASIAKMTRESMLDALNQDYIRVLRAAGVHDSSIIFKHALRNAATPVVTVISLFGISALTATVFIETVFVMPGLGTIAVQAALQSRIQLLEGVAICFTLMVIVINLVVDILYGLINPKVRRA